MKLWFLHRKPISLSPNLWLTVIIWRHSAVCLPPSPFAPMLCPWLKCWSQMQLASQKGRQTCGHRVSGSCHGRLSWGCPGSRAAWQSLQETGWKDFEIESERGSTSAPTAVGMHKILTSEVAKTNHFVVSLRVLYTRGVTACLQKKLGAASVHTLTCFLSSCFNLCMAWGDNSRDEKRGRKSAAGEEEEEENLSEELKASLWSLSNLGAECTKLEKYSWRVRVK